MPNSKINVTDLDFDQIKNNLKEYLRGQSEFTDYDFEGSALSTLLDVLAYNTHYQGLYYNLAVNESFLDSASKRSSVISKAHELGYTPRSIISSKAIVDLTMVNNQISAPDLIELPKYTPFTTNIDGVTYTFYTTENHIAYKNNTVYSFNNIQIVEGYPLSYQYNIVADTKNIIIPNTNVDASSIRVKVQDSAEVSNFVTFTQSDTILNIDGKSNVYFLKELSTGQLQLQFGNDVIGKALDIGNIVTVEYFVTKGPIANGARTFSYAGNNISNTSISVTVINPSFGGTNAETIEQIRFNAPRFYTNQNRCITIQDYKSTITALYPLVKSVSVWGGEDNNPPRYGEVLISPISQSGEPLSESEKDFLLTNIINPRKPVTTRITFIDPEFIDLSLDVTFYYDVKNTTRTSLDLTKLVRDSILRYNNDYLNQFEGVFRYSVLANAIDNADISIINNIFRIKAYVSFFPLYNRNASYQIIFGNPIHQPAAPEESVLSDGFVISTNDNVCYIDDVPLPNTQMGNLRLFYLQNNIKIVVNSNIGTVHYSTGVISINDLNIISSINPSITFAIKTESNDVVSTNNKLIRIDDNRLFVKAIPQANLGQYQFISSRT